MPRPPWERSSERSTWVNRSKTLESISAAMPIPLSRTRKTASLPDRVRSRSILPPSVCILGGVVQQVGEHLGDPYQVGVHRQGYRRRGQRQHVLARIDQRPADLDRAGDDRPRVDGLDAELDLSAGDPRDVEQVVDQSHQLLDLPGDDVAGPPRFSSSISSICSISTALRIGASGLRSSWASIARNSFLRRSFSWTSR